MFKSLLANLAFNPSLLEQVTVYIKHLKAEAALRKAGLVFIVLAFVVQLIAISSLTPNSLIASSPKTSLSYTQSLTASANKLPTTSGKTSLIVGLSIAILAALLFMRAKLLARELKIVHRQYTATGGS